MLAAISLSLALAPQAPITELLTAYPRGEQLTCAVSADGARSFVADGASIAVLDTSTLVPEIYPNNVIRWIDVPDATPNRMLVYRGSLYIAGGTGGLFRLALSDGYFTTPPGALSHTLTVLDSPFLTNGRAGDASTYRWKRCVDVATVDQPGRRLVFGLFAASQRHIEVGDLPIFGATELLAWQLNGAAPATYYGRFVFDSAAVPPVGGQNDIKGTALAVDPGDSSSMYVALGIRWIWRVDISSVSSGADPRFASAAELQFSTQGGNLLPCVGSPCPEGERMRDLALVRRPVAGGTQALGYAAMEYGRLIEFELPAPPAVTASVFTIYSNGCNHGERVSAVVGETDDVIVAYGTQPPSATFADSAAPFRPTGLWRDACITVSIPEPNPPLATPGPCEDSGIRILRRRPTANLLGGLQPMGLSALPGVLGNSGLLTDTYWGDVIVQSLGVDHYRIHESTLSGGFSVHVISHDPLPQSGMGMMMGGPTVPWTILEHAHYQGPTTGHSDGIVAASDDTLVYFGGEPFGDHPPQGSMFRVVPPAPPSQPTWSLVPIPNTGQVCPSLGDEVEFVDCEPFLPQPPEPFQFDVVNDPNPFLGGILGSASWEDPWDGTGPDVPSHPVREWFIAGGPTWRQGDCTTIPGVGNCAFTDPCSGPDPAPWRKSWLPSFDNLTPLDLANQSRVGWKYVLLDPLAVDGVAMGMKWWQVVAPTGAPSSKASTTDYVYSESDPRVDVLGVNQARVPKILHNTRGASATGYKTSSPQAFMRKAAEVCPGTPVADQGHGQELEGTPFSPPSGPPTFFESITHVEFEEIPGGEECRPFVPSTFCAGPSAAYRNAHNNKCEVFPLQTQSFGLRYVTAIAAGFVASAPSVTPPPNNEQGTACQWTAEFGRLLVTFYDVTDTPGNADGLNPTGAPVLLRVALGPYQGHAFSVRAKEYADGKTYVFVADLIGEIHAIDISGDLLFSPAASVPFYRPPGCGTTCTPVLSTEGAAGSRFRFPRDLIDGYRPNCVDIEIDGDVLYCALARGGIALLDISRPNGTPLNIQPIVILDTPGLAQGIAWRGTGANRQMLVGDSRAGLRLYARAGVQ